MADIFYDHDADLAQLANLTIAVIGYGNQGRAHALNMRDSGLRVIAGCREQGGRAASLAAADAIEVRAIGQAADEADILAIMLPDEVVPVVFATAIEPALRSGKGLVFAHGFVVHHKSISIPKDLDLMLVAPTGPGRQLRSLYEAGSGLPALVAVEQDFTGLAWARCLAYARSIGCTRAGAIRTTIAEETVTDLFCEQAVLCGGLPDLIKASFSTLIARGYQPELAYISCLKEVKLIADLLFEQGIDGMRRAISNTAKFGSAVAGPALIDDKTRQSLGQILDNIESGNFARDFAADTRDDSRIVRNLVLEEENSALAKLGKELSHKLKF